MLVKKKLKYVTEDEYYRWYSFYCDNDVTRTCARCLFYRNKMPCRYDMNDCWVRHKEIYSDKILNQKISIEVEDILTKQEKEYLSSMLYPFQERVISVTKMSSGDVDEYIQITYKLIEGSANTSIIILPLFKSGTMYVGMKINKKYTLEELDLFTSLPNKGEIILLDVDNKGDKKYRVLKRNGNIVEVLGMTNLYNCQYKDEGNVSEQNFDKGHCGQVYGGSQVDHYLSKTWYRTLSNIAKGALVQKKIIQKMYTKDNGVSTSATYNGTEELFNRPYHLTLVDQIDCGSRYIYTLGIEDIVEYIGNGVENLNMANINIMYFNSPDDFIFQDIWLNSAYDAVYYGSERYTFSVQRDSGSLHVRSATTPHYIRPSFQIDLSKIGWRRDKYKETSKTEK